jgi:hypothetical protein
VWDFATSEEHQRLVGKLQQLPITEWKWENITIVFLTRLPRGMKGNDAIWVIMDGLQSQLYSTYENDRSGGKVGKIICR